MDGSALEIFSAGESAEGIKKNGRVLALPLKVLSLQQRISFDCVSLQYSKAMRQMSTMPYSRPGQSHQTTSDSMATHALCLLYYMYLR